MTSGVPDATKFAAFVANQMRIPTPYLPPDSPYLTYSLDQAINLVNLDIAALPFVPGAWSLYELAVYNLAGAMLVEFVPDQSYPIASVAWGGSLVTVTTAAPNSVQPGDKLFVNGISPNGYNGLITANAVIDPSNFNYPLAPQPSGTINVLAGAAATEQYFAAARKSFKLAGFAPGIISSTSDAGTSASFDNPDFAKGLTLFDLQLLKTPWGRAYLNIAQKYGPTIWGMS